MKLKLSEIASIAEVIGAVAIVISLVYVGVQVTDSTRAVRSATANETYATLSSWYAQMGTNREASHNFWNGMTNPESLSPEELFQYVMATHAVILEYQAAYYLAQEGTLDVELQESIFNTLLGIREQPGFLLYWEQRRDLFKADFRRVIDEMMVGGTTNANVQRVYQPRELE